MTALVAVQVVQRLRVADDGLYLYRGILHPDVDDLAFIGCGADTLNSLQTAGLQARWLASLLQGSLHLPSRAVQHADLTAQQVWRRSFFPAAHNRAARYAQYTVDYHAQLTRDMSCSSGQQEPGLLGTCLPCLARPSSRCPAASPQPCSQPSATTPNACHPTQQHLSPLGPRLAAPTLPVGHGPPSLHALYATWQLQPQPQHQAQPQYDQLAQHGGNGSTLVAPPHLSSPTLPAARSDQDPGASCYSPAAGLAAGLPLEVLGHAGAWVNEQGLLSLTSEAGRSSSSQTQLAFGHGGCEEVAGQCAGHAMQSGHWSDKSAAARSAGTMQPLSPVMEGYTTGHASPLTPMLCQEKASAPAGHWGGAVQQDGWPHVLSPAPHLSGHPSTAAADAGQEDAHDEEADENAQAAIMRQLQQRTHSAQQLAMYVMASSAAQQRTSRRTSRALSRARSITGRFGAQSASTEGQHSVGDRIRCQQTSMSFTAGATPGARTLQHNFMQARRSRLADVSLPGSPPSHNSSTSSLMVERGAMSTFNSSFTHSTLARRVTLTAGFTVAIQAADAAHPVLTSHQTTPARAAPVLRHTSQPGNQGLQQQQQQEAPLGVVPLQQSVLSRELQGSLGREVTASSLQADPLLHHSHQDHDHGMRQAQAAQAQAQAAQEQLNTPSAAPASPAAVRSCFAHAVALPAREQALAHASGRTPASVAEGGEAHTSHTTEAAGCGALHLAAQGSTAAAEQRELGLTPLNGHVPKVRSDLVHPSTRFINPACHMCLFR
ncbi:hypothetical protein QJQ45_021031 [Haematococcus lacustris]|nr:hypothetical protein QJQ45_021031 [Haematococcus lacustris]